eukprot:TRINITY_DN1945_c0_g1_i1.p2 TRINITY_DN1945_c0_g1~~TRINITY_DN1945_c0_g1_i1.p2  ORF type:complete len:232 (+),score=77.65 TRINITY_DN1945_c0_g1_i1:112-807(+)
MAFVTSRVLRQIVFKDSSCRMSQMLNPTAFSLLSHLTPSSIQHFDINNNITSSSSQPEILTPDSITFANNTSSTSSQIRLPSIFEENIISSANYHQYMDHLSFAHTLHSTNNISHNYDHHQKQQPQQQQHQKQQQQQSVSSSASASPAVVVDSVISNNNEVMVPSYDQEAIIIEFPEESEKAPVLAIKRPFQPHLKRGQRKHGFLARLGSKNGRKILNRRRVKGRHSLVGV